MISRRLLIISLVAVVGLVAWPAHAQQILRVTVQAVPESQRAEGWLSTLRLFLGSRIIQPAEGTKFIVQSSAYASSPLQTDSTPCITAAGTTVRPGVVATNFLPLGTLLSINGEVFIVEDRMNARYGGHYLDIWFPSTSAALQHGRQNIEIEVIGYGKPGQELPREKEDEDVEQPTVFRRANLRFIALAKTLAAYLSTRISGDVDRFDIDCQPELPEVEFTE